jgi:hypothetical protein
MKKFEIQYENWHSFKEETGDDLVFFDCMVCVADDPAINFPLSLPYRLIEQQVENSIPDGRAVMQQIKKRINGWGPQESLYVQELAECGINLEEIVKKAVENNVDLEKEALRYKNLGSGSIQLNDLLVKMEDSLAGVKAETDCYYLLCTNIEKVITNEVTNLFPVLLESSSDHILNLQDIIVRHIPDLASDLSDLIMEAENNKEL